MSLVHIRDLRNKKAEDQQKRYLDAKASYVSLDECYKVISVNNMTELAEVKKAIKSAMKKLEKIDNGR